MKSARLSYLWLLLVVSYAWMADSKSVLGCDGNCPGQAQINWLVGQQELHDTGLVESYADNNDPNAYTFDQALAAIAFTEGGKLTEARSILNVMAELQLGDPNGAWYECYHGNDPNLTWRGCKKYVTGPIAWMVIAISFYEDKTGDANYASTARRAVGWLDTMQNMELAEESYGALRFSNVDPDIFSTEHNLDGYAAYHGRGTLDSNGLYFYRAGLILDFLRREMWAPSLDSNHWHDINIFWRGLEVNPNFCTDPQSWGVLSLGPIGPDGEQFYKSLCWLLDPVDSTRTVQDYNENITAVDGFKGCTGEEDYIEVDFTEHVAAAFYSIGDDVNGNYFHNQMGRTVDANGGLVHSFCDHDSNIGWYKTYKNYRYDYVASVAWYYFNEVKINPFKLPSAEPWARAANIDKKGRVDFSDVSILASDWLESGPDLAGNIDGVGWVDFRDFGILAAYWLCGCSD